MLTSLALIFLLAIVFSKLSKMLKIPTLVGILIAGIVLGPSVLNLLDAKLLNISAELRKIALVIILTRAGLALDLRDLKKVGLPAILMCFIPATIEITAMVLIAPQILGISYLDAAIMGTVVAAVSPAVVVPKMIDLMERGYGTKQSIPQMIMASASVDDIFVIVLFTSFLGLAQGESFSYGRFIDVPVAVITGVIAGLLVGYLLSILFKKVQIKDALKIIIVLSAAFLLLQLESFISNYVAFSGLLAIMSTGIAIKKWTGDIAANLSAKFTELWAGAEILLFALVGAALNITYAMDAGLSAVILILLVVCFRMIGVFICLLKSNLNIKERIFCMISYSPKATVQAAIGSIPLSIGLGCGEIVLTVAVVSILVTAPLGAFGIDITHKKFLSHN